MMSIRVNSEQEMRDLGIRLAPIVAKYRVLELVGDVGSGKTTLTKSLAKELGVEDEVQSPSFTVSRTYDTADGHQLVHYDFYRLPDPGIMRYDILENLEDEHTIVVIEWANSLEAVLPSSRITLKLAVLSEESREVQVEAGGKNIEGEID